MQKKTFGAAKMMPPAELQGWIHAVDAEVTVKVIQQQSQEADFRRALQLEAMRIPAIAAVYYIENCKLAGYTGQIPITEAEITEDP